MIAIFSQRDFEVSTEEVMDWLTYRKANFFRWNGGDFIEELEYDENDAFEFIKPLMSDINVCWFRRWMDHGYVEKIAENNTISLENYTRVYKHLRGELLAVNSRLWQTLKHKKWLTSPKEISLNKLDVLNTARSLGLNCPPTIITTHKSKMLDFMNKYQRIISKAIGEVVFLKAENKRLTLKTVEISNEDLGKIPDRFFPTMFQQLIEKKYEIRAFYLNRKFYSMAIFSQNDPQTAVDFRNYNIKRPNRRVPYQIPHEIEIKLLDMMENLNISTCSIDLIKSIDNDYYFLEINPVGQFGMTSKPCNYYLEQKIADFLISKDTNDEK